MQERREGRKQNPCRVCLRHQGSEASLKGSQTFMQGHGVERGEAKRCVCEVQSSRADKENCECRECHRSGDLRGNLGRDRWYRKQ